MALQNHWKSETLIGFDLETSGKYPIQSEICEIGAVKWKDGQIIDKFTTLIRPKRTMSAEVISIHNITNEMVEDAPPIEEKIHEFYEFIKGGYLIAHHAPFDLGFLTHEFEKQSLVLPYIPVFCSSMLSRTIVSGTQNHKLQTLVKHFKIEGGQAHRATDDANACLQLAMICFGKVGPDMTIDELFQFQHKKLYWLDYSIKELEKRIEFEGLIRACFEFKEAKIIYRGGSRPGKARMVRPLGLVRNPMGDFLAAEDLEDNNKEKRFYLEKVQDSECL